MIEYTMQEILESRDEEMRELPERCDESIEMIQRRFTGDIAITEVLHTAYIVMENVESYLLTSPTVILDEDAYILAHQAHTVLFNLYQHLGAKRSEVEWIDQKIEREPMSAEEMGCANDCTHPDHHH